MPNESYMIPMPVETVKEAEEFPSLTYRLDIDAGRIVGKVDGLQAVKQAIRKAIVTPRFKCLIYDDQYGCEIVDAVTANDAPREYVEAVAEEFIKDALRPDTRILGVSNFQLEFLGDSVFISFSASTIFGAVDIEEVI